MDGALPVTETVVDGAASATGRRRPGPPASSAALDEKEARPPRQHGEAVSLSAATATACRSRPSAARTASRGTRVPLPKNHAPPASSRDKIKNDRDDDADRNYFVAIADWTYAAFLIIECDRDLQLFDSLATSRSCLLTIGKPRRTSARACRVLGAEASIGSRSVWRRHREAAAETDAATAATRSTREPDGKMAVPDGPEEQEADSAMSRSTRPRAVVMTARFCAVESRPSRSCLQRQQFSSMYSPFMLLYCCTG